jgi:hypothetical protein
MRAFVLALLVVSSVSSVALADDPVPHEQEVIVIHGSPHGPGVVPVLSRARFRYRAPDLERRATDAIAETVQRPPF